MQYRCHYAGVSEIRGREAGARGVKTSVRRAQA